MAKDTKNAVLVDGQEYFVEDMTQDQQTLLNHVIDLDRKLANAKFSLDQLQVGRDAFFSMLKSKLETVTDVEAK